MMVCALPNIALKFLPECVMFGTAPIVRVSFGNERRLNQGLVKPRPIERAFKSLKEQAPNGGIRPTQPKPSARCLTGGRGRAVDATLRIRRSTPGARALRIGYCARPRVFSYNPY